MKAGSQIIFGDAFSDNIILARFDAASVCMHSVPEEAIYRPTAWAALDMDPEGQDFRACNVFGPLYG